MTASKYFTHYTSKTEPALLDQLMSETIRMYGINAIYIPRNGDVDIFHGEDPLAKFSTWFEFVAYIKTVEGFNGKGFLQKWGMTLEQTVTFQISKSEFIGEAKKELEPNRPREGDLIYLPYGVTDRFLLEIKYVRDNVPFQQLGHEYIYECDCRLFTYSNEDIKTGFPEVDAIGAELKQTFEVLVGAGTGTFDVGEIVYQGPSFAGSTFRAVVKEYIAAQNLIKLTNIAGSFLSGANLVGNTSGAVRVGGGDQQRITNDPRAQNYHIEQTSDPIIVRNPRNPFDRGRI
jgi:hypothetical protein